MDLSLIVDGIPHKDKDKNSNGQNHQSFPIDDIKTLITSPSSPLTSIPSLAKKLSSLTEKSISKEVASQTNSIVSPPTSPFRVHDPAPELDGVKGICDRVDCFETDLTRLSLLSGPTQSHTLPSPRLSVSSNASSTNSSVPEYVSSPSNQTSPGATSDSKEPKIVNAVSTLSVPSSSETMALFALTQTQSLRSQNEYQYPCYQQIPQCHSSSSHLLNTATGVATNGAISAPIAHPSLAVHGVIPQPMSSVTVPTDLSQIPYIFHTSVSVVPRISSTLLPTHGHSHAHFGVLPPYSYTNKLYEMNPPHFPSESLSTTGSVSTLENPTFKREICNNKNNQRLTKTTTQPTVNPPAVLPLRTERAPARNNIDKEKSKSSLKAKQFSCDKCGRSFCRKSDLVRHFQIHLGIKPNVCKTCGKQFLQRSALTVHIRVHTGEKPYSCHYCSRPFSDSSSLARHRRIHIRNQEQPRVFVPASTSRTSLVSPQILPGPTRTSS